MKEAIPLFFVCITVAACGGSDSLPPAGQPGEAASPDLQTGFIVNDGAVEVAAQLLNPEGLQWHCAGQFEGDDWSAEIRFGDDGFAAYTFASGEALMMTWTIDDDSRAISWDEDQDGMPDRAATLVGPILNLASDSFHNLRETFTEVSINGRELRMKRVRERDSRLHSGNMVCDER